MSKQKIYRDRIHIAFRARRQFQRLAFASLYRFGGRIYDVLTTLLFGEAWDRWRRSVVPFIPNGPVIDLGCGTGALVSELGDQGLRAIGIDREASMLAQAARRDGTRGRLVRAEASSLPFLPGSFRACVATFPSAFITRSETLDEVARVLTSGGTFVVVLTGEARHEVWWRFPIRLLLRVFYGPAGGRSIPENQMLEHPLFKGRWAWIDEGRDSALLWIATRIDNQDCSEFRPTPSDQREDPL